LCFLVGAMSFAVADGPESVAVYEHGVKELSMSCIRFKLGRGVDTVDVILLDGLPGGYDSAAYQMAPADGGLVDGKLAVDWWIVGKFRLWGAAKVEVQPDACEKNMNKFGVSLAIFCTFAGELDER
jgi:hypothetical protein